MFRTAPLALALLICAAQAAAQPIEDPENPATWTGGTLEDSESPATWTGGTLEDSESPTTWTGGTLEDPENPGSGAIVDPENPGSGAIFDPENPSSGAIVDPENPGSGAIVDPENAGTPPAPTAPRSPLSAAGGGTPVAIFSGAFRSTASVDTRRDDAWEDTLELTQELEMRVRFRLHDLWRAITEGRLTWNLTGPGDPGDPAWIPDANRMQGRVTPELRDFYVSGRAGRWLMRFGNQSIVWGSTDISKPADIINPIDLRRGLSAEREDIRVPVPAFDLVHVWDQVSWEFVLVPFFVPHRVSIYGADTSPLSPGALGLPLIPGITDIALIDPSLEDLVQPLLLQTALPEETPRNVSAGSRLTLIRGGWDVSLGYFYGWDRVPRLRLHPSAVALVNAVLNQGGGFFDQDLESAPQLQDVLDAIASGQSVVSAEYDRLHTVEFDGVTYAGPIGIRFETAVNPRRTAYTQSFRSVRRASVSSALGLSYESSDGDIVVSSEVFHMFFAHRSGDGPYLYGMDNLLGVAAGLQLGISAFAGADGTKWERFGMQLAAIYLPDGRDLVASPAISYDATDRLELSVGASIFASFGDGATLGDMLERNDAVFIKLARVF